MPTSLYDITDPPDPTKGSLGGEGSTRNFTPAANFNGTVDIGYTLADRGDPDTCSAANPCAAANMSAQKSVSVTVDAVNDTPSFTRAQIRQGMRMPERRAFLIGPPLSLVVPTSRARRWTSSSPTTIAGCSPLEESLSRPQRNPNLHACCRQERLCHRQDQGQRQWRYDKRRAGPERRADLPDSAQRRERCAWLHQGRERDGKRGFRSAEGRRLGYRHLFPVPPTSPPAVDLRGHQRQQQPVHLERAAFCGPRRHAQLHACR